MNWKRGDTATEGKEKERNGLREGGDVFPEDICSILNLRLKGISDNCENQGEKKWNLK